MPDENSKTVTVPYVPYKTFTAVLDSFVTFLPDVIDVSLWPSYSGGTKSQLIGALRFLGLIRADGTPSPELRKMSEKKETRPSVIAEILRKAYLPLFALDLAKTTPAAFDKVLREEYGQEGETHRKAASFFLAAAKHAGIALSPPLTARGRLAPSKKKSNGSRGTRQQTPPPVTPVIGTQAGPVKAVSLSEGVVLRLTANKDLFRMTKEDRTFVLGLLDAMDEYEGSTVLDAYDEAEEETD